MSDVVNITPAAFTSHISKYPFQTGLAWKFRPIFFLKIPACKETAIHDQRVGRLYKQ